MPGKKWTTSDISSLKGKVIIVTGGNSGIGYEAVKVFAEKGARVVMACKSLKRANKARQKIKKEVENADIDVIHIDLRSLASVHDFVKTFKKKYKRLDILLNNAGIMMTPYGRTKDGFELQLGVNHLGHFALTGLLLDILMKTKKARIVNISSIAHQFSSFDFDNLLSESGEGYSPINAYRQSKLANLLFTYELQRRLKKRGVDTICLAAHPGISRTNLSRYSKRRLLFRILGPLIRIVEQSAERGALPGIRACTDNKALGGQYYGPSGWKGMKGDPVIVQSSEASHIKEDANRLWKISEKLTKAVYKI